MATSVQASKVTLLLHECVPDLDQPIVDYIVGYLPDTGNSTDKKPTGLQQQGLSEEEVDESVEPTVRALLESAGGAQAKIDSVVRELRTILLEQLRDAAQRAGGNDKDKRGLVRLQQPVHMLSQQDMAQTSRLANVGRAVDLAAVKGRTVASQVDLDKLRKAEAKIKAKMEKRERRAAYEASKLLDQSQNMGEEELSILQVNPIMDYTLTKGQSKDIKVDQVDISFSGKRILTNTSLTLAHSRRYGVIGRNGIGKSTLLRAISRRELDIPTHISILHVEQEMVGDETTALRSVLKADIWREHLLREEQRLLTDIKALENTPKEESEGDSQEMDKEALGSQLQEVYTKLEEIESDKAESKAAAILSGLGFTQAQLSQPTKSFSGGWRMRLSLARALFCQPDLLLLDEPTNMLDIPAVVWLEHYLKQWPSTLVVVSHDREFLDEVATDIIHQHSEKLDYYRGNFSQFYATKEERRKNQLREYESQMQYRQHLQAFIDRWRYNANRAAQAQSKIKILEKLPALEAPLDEAVVTFRFPDPDQLGPPILQMDEVSFGYQPDKPILSHVNLDMQMNSRIAVVGPNGAGKTTMLKLLIQKLEPQHGLVHRHGRLRIAYFTQHHVDQLDMNLSPVAYLAKAFPGKGEEEYRRHLGAFGITGMVGLQTIRTLSGGQKSRVSFACLAIQHPHILVLDEPTNHLDMDSIDALTNALREFGGGVVLVSHDERFIDAVANELWVCQDGTLSKFRGEGIKEYKNIICPPDSVML